MPDIIKEAYDILNYHLGTDQRGMKRLPPEREELLHDIEKLVQYAYLQGILKGKDHIHSMYQMKLNAMRDELLLSINDANNAIKELDYKSKV